MTRLRLAWRRLRATVGSRRLDRELRDEIDAHLAEAAEEHMRRGLSPEEARRAALRGFGGVAQVEEVHREIRSIGWLDDLRRDLRHTGRGMVRHPSFTLVTVLTLALGIGATTTMFTLLDAVVLRPLAVPAPHELFTFYENGPEGVPDPVGGTGRYLRFSYSRFQRLQRALGTHGSMAAVTRSARLVGRLPGRSGRRYVFAQFVWGHYVAALGITASRGRVLTDADARLDQATPVAVVSDRFWRQALEADVGALGRTLVINDLAVTIVGIGPPGFSGLWSDAEADLWLPVSLQQPVRHETNYSSYGSVDRRQPWITQQVSWLNLVARVPGGDLRPWMPALQAANHEGLLDLTTIISSPESRESMLTHTLAAEPLSQGFSGLRARFSDVLFALTGMAALVLFVTCANIASLLLARSAAQARDLSIRLSLGATTARLVRQCLTESLAIALLGGAAGVAVSRWASTFLAREVLGGTGTLPQVFDAGARVLVFAMSVTVLTAAGFGLAPAFRALGAGRRAALGGNQRETVGHGTMKGLQWLVAGQFALSVALVAAAALLGRTLVNFLRVDPGFAAGQLVSASFDPVSSGYTPDQFAPLAHRLVASAAALPGVRAAAASTCGLVAGCSSSSGFRIEGLPEDGHTLYENRVSAGYFATVGMPLVAGREFDGRDVATGAHVAVLNQAAVRQFFDGRNPIGLHIGSGALDIEIVGVVRDAHTQTLHDPAVPMAYFPLDQQIGRQLAVPGNLDLRVAPGSQGIENTLRDMFRQVEPNLLAGSVVWMSDRLARDLTRERLAAYLTFGFGALTLLLASLGLYGLLSYGVAQRTQEIGVRMALGARRTDVLWLIGRQSARLTAAGVVAGMTATAAGSRYLAGLLYGVTPLDPGTLVLATLVLAAAALLASLLPARRAATVDPLIALRCD